MKVKWRRRLILLIPVLIVFLSGCSQYSDFNRGFYAGETITPERLAEISLELAASEKAPSGDSGTTQGETEKKVFLTDEFGNIVVYWTAGGSVWHYKRDCGALINSAAIESGPIDKAMEAGMERACRKCGTVDTAIQGDTSESENP